MESRTLLDNSFLDELEDPEVRAAYANDPYFVDEEDDARVRADLFRNRQMGINDLLQHFGLFGTTGSGKTTTAARILENYAELQVPFTCWDYEATSYYTIPEIYPKVQFKRLSPLLDDETYEEYLSNQSSKDYKQYFSNYLKQLDFQKVPECQEKLAKIADLAEKNYLTSQMSILSMEDLPDDAMRCCIGWVYTRAMYNLANELKEKEEQLLHVSFFDEAEWAMPWYGAERERNLYTFKLLDICSRIATAGRKRWMLLGVASQRLTQIATNIKTQLQNVILLKASPQDLWHYEGFMKNLPMGARKALSGRALSMPAGQAMLVQNGWVNPNLWVIKRKSRHTDTNASYFKARARAVKKRAEYYSEGQ